MSSIRTLLNMLRSNPKKIPDALVNKINRAGYLKWMPDKAFLKLKFRTAMEKPLDLKAPKTFNEKLQWLKLYDRRPEYTTYVDKYRVRDYVRQILGEEYLIPVLGVWESADDIDFETLPQQFVLKCNHDSGSVMVVRDKASLDEAAIKNRFNKRLNTSFYWLGREWPYKDVKPCIIAEKYMTDDENSTGFTDYKFYCFNGSADSVMVCLERGTGQPKFYFFDQQWRLLRYNIRGMEAPEGFSVPKPEKMDEMFAIAERLSTGIPHVRVDLYVSNGQIYFGEMTFFSENGWDKNLLPETDKKWGEKILLPTKK